MLGPLQIEHRHCRIDLGVRRQRLIFGLLALRAGTPVQMGALIEIAWFDKGPPVTARNAIQVCVSRLRPALAGFASIVTVGDGYRLDTDRGNIDLDRFRRCVAAARTLDGERAVTALRHAERLWRGPVLASELPDATRQHLCGGLEDERIAATEERIGAELRLDRHRQLIGELTDLVRAHPTRERLVGHLMLALYRDDQAARALEVCRRARARFADELGIDPGTAIRELEVAILRQAPELMVTATATAPAATKAAPAAAPAATAPAATVTVPAGPAVPAQLPAGSHGFTGRADQLTALDSLLPPAPHGARIALITGTAGVGKTALALHWAHRVRARFPDGQLHVDLRGQCADPPVQPLDALARFLRVAGMRAERIPFDVTDAATAYRSLLADRRMLIMLDNADSADQIRPLLPAGQGCVVVVTCRDRLDGLIARDGARLVDLDVLDPAESAALLAGLIGADRVRAEQEATAELAALCAHLPLALRIAGAALVGQPAQTIAGYVARLRGGDRLTALSVDGDPDSAVRTAFDTSYAALPVPLRRIFTLIGLIPGADVTAAAMAAMTGMTSQSADLLLRRLVAQHLVVEHGPGRFGLHDLLRLYAAERASDDEDPSLRTGAVSRVVSWYLDGARAASQRLYPGQQLQGCDERPSGGSSFAFTDDAAAISWLNAERANLVAAVPYAARNGLDVAAWQIADVLSGYFWHGRHVLEWQQAAWAGLAAAIRTGDPRAQAALRIGLGMVSHCLARHSEAIGEYSAAYQFAQTSAWPAGQQACLTGLGNLHVATGDLATADGLYRRALTLSRTNDDERAEGAALTNLGIVSCQRGQLGEAAQQHAESLRLARRIGSRGPEATALRYLGYTVHLQGDLDQALELLSQALHIDRRRGSRNGEGQSLMDIAGVHHDAGRAGPAEAAIEASLTLVSGTGERYAEAFALNGRGRLRVSSGDVHGALADHAAALDLARAAGALYSQIESLIGLATATCAAAQFPEAVSHAESALTTARRAGYLVLAGQAGTSLAVALWRAGDTCRAADEAEAALALHRETGHRIGEAHALTTLGGLLRSADPATAAGHEQAARAILRACGASASATTGPSREYTSYAPNV